ncbi:hypothetical protein [Paraburkholderia strydomiana]|uniref:hypothetical protein n=1 Tax=Paraburkholderia strydomiana TaxID=1245417 RepID=UPI002860E4A9|nr:acyl CoA:acetate/3-ketoacid CoA transferase [Paraburkholderia strydomiana]
MKISGILVDFVVVDAEQRQRFNGSDHPIDAALDRAAANSIVAEPAVEACTGQVVWTRCARYSSLTHGDT